MQSLLENFELLLANALNAVRGMQSGRTLVNISSFDEGVTAPRRGDLSIDGVF